jgi:hypothetical protein
MSALNSVTSRIACLALVSALGACAFGNTVNYSAQAPAVNVKPTEVIAVGVQDRRPYVVSGEKTVQFVGLQRSGFGIPYGVHTNSGRALADEFSDSIAGSLTTQEQKPQVVRLTPSMSREQVVAALMGTGANKVLLVTINEWKSDLYANLRIIYDVQATVLDRTGKPLGEHQVKGDQNLGSHMTMFPAYSTTLPTFQKTKLEELLNNPQLGSAFTQPTRPQPPTRAARRK